MVPRQLACTRLRMRHPRCRTPQLAASTIRQVGLVKRKKNEKAKMPKEITEARPDVEKRLNQKCVHTQQAGVCAPLWRGQPPFLQHPLRLPQRNTHPPLQLCPSVCAIIGRPAWSEHATLTSNYQANKLLLDPNEGFGRNLRPAPLKSKEERKAEDGCTYSDDDGARGGGPAARRGQGAAAGGPGAGEQVAASLRSHACAPPSLRHPEIRVAVGQMRKTGKAAPKPLTATQTAVVTKLLAAHGEDVEVSC